MTPARTAGRLLRVARRGASVARFAWDAATGDRLAMPAALVSLAGTAAWAELDDARRADLARLELVRFFSLNVAGEARLVRGLDAAASTASEPVIRTYLARFASEEREHTDVFRRFCTRHGRVYPDRQLAFPRPRAPGEAELVFHAEALLFEEIAVWWNRRIAASDETWPLAREINAYHAEDEAMHIAYGRAAVRSLWERYAPGWDPSLRERTLAHLRAFVHATLAMYVEPAVYADAGLPDPYALRRAALASCRVVHEAASRRALDLVRELEETT